MDLDILILAAGKGTRMRSQRPKVLHELAGRSLLQHVHDTAAGLAPTRLAVVYGHGGEQVREALRAPRATWVLQAEQRGTGHAVQLALNALDAAADDGVVLILYGDVPLISADTLAPLIDAARSGALALLTVRLADPQGYGRIVRNRDGKVLRIVENRDASPAELAIDEINTGIMALRRAQLAQLLAAIDCNNAQGEYYLTDVVGLAVAQDQPVAAITTDSPSEVMGINSRAQLAELERVYQSQTAARLMAQGVTLADPARCDVRGELIAGEDVFIDVGCVFEGVVKLGRGVHIGPYCVLRDSKCADDAQILSHSVLDGAELAEHATVGPFARLRPGARLAADSKVGNFVEVKNAQIGEGSKANHLAYIGDATLGRKVNIGAGTITANYDGANKHHSHIDDEVSVGSNSVLVAPVHVGAGATIGAGSTVSGEIAGGELTVARARARTVSGWQRPRKNKPGG